MLSRLTAICREHLLREKILVAPSLAIGHQIADALAQRGTPWVNLRIETLRTIADAIAGFDIAQRGLTVLSRAQSLALVERACDRALGHDSYFAALADRPGLHRAIQRSLDDLRHAGADPAAMPVSAFEDPRKAADLGRILAAYEEELESGRYIDRIGVLARATALLRSGAMKPWSADAIWLVFEELELTSAEEGLLRLAAGDYEVIRSVANATPAIDFRSAVGEENEIRAAFRALLVGGRRFDEAEIVYTTRDPYLPLAIELAAEYDVPCTFAEGVPSYFTRPGQACLAFLAWMGGGWHAAELQLAATSGAIRIDDVSGPAFTRMLRKSGIGWGRERYLPRIDATLAETEAALEAEEDDAQKEWLQREAGLLRGTRAAIVSLLEATEAVATGQAIDVAAAARAASSFVTQFGAIRSGIDGMARDAIARMLDELAGLPNVAIDRGEAASRLADAVREVHVSASNPQPGSLHVAPLRAGGWSGRPRLFVAGLDESRHPGRGLQDPVVLDAEREAINHSIDPHRLLLMADAPRRAAEQFRHLLRRASASAITLSYSTLDLSDRKERFPSRAFLQAYRANTGHPQATYDDVAKLVERDGFVDRFPISATEWWLMRRFIDYDTDTGAALRRAYPLLGWGAEADAARATDAITAWDGRVEADGAALDPRRNGRVYSASQLETMAGCPFRYFVERHLHVKANEEPEFDPDRWLQPSEFGSMVHEVLQLTMETLRAAGAKPALAFLPQMEAIAEAALQRWRVKVPPPGEAPFERGRSDLLTVCDIFLRSEEEPCRSVTPKHFEVSFGFGEEGRETIAMAEPFVLPLGKGRSIQLRGRIDRVDHDEANDEWHVWDYKSGMARDYEGPGHLRAGTKVQHAIYARALQEMIRRKGERGTVTRSGYFFPSAKGRGARVVPGATDAELKKSINALSDLVAHGLFPHVESVQCRWCDLQDVCGGATVADAQIQRKLAANPDDEAVKAWMTLQDVK